MDDEDRIRALIGEIASRKRQGIHVSPSAAALILTALRFYLAARQWLRAPPPVEQASLEPGGEKKKPERYEGPLPTIGDMRRQGLRSATITCDGPNCWNSQSIAFETFALPDETAFLAIPQSRGFRCSRCGCRRVRISPDWTDHVAHGNGRALAPGRE